MILEANVMKLIFRYDITNSVVGILEKLIEIRETYVDVESYTPCSDFN